MGRAVNEGHMNCVGNTALPTQSLPFGSRVIRPPPRALGLKDPCPPLAAHRPHSATPKVAQVGL